MLAVSMLRLSARAIVIEPRASATDKANKVDVRLGSAKLSPLSGNGQLTELFVGNPEGYKSPSAIAVGSMGISVVPGSVMADKVVIRYVKVESPVWSRSRLPSPSKQAATVRYRSQVDPRMPSAALHRRGTHQDT